jgi:hypothetical protein
LAYYSASRVKIVDRVITSVCIEVPLSGVSKLEDRVLLGPSAGAGLVVAGAEVQESAGRVVAGSVAPRVVLRDVLPRSVEGGVAVGVVVVGGGEVAAGGDERNGGVMPVVDVVVLAVGAVLGDQPALGPSLVVGCSCAGGLELYPEESVG